MIIKTPSSNRFIEIDLLRGLAITLMVFGHILWDLDYFGLVSMNNTAYDMLQKIVPPLFFILIGMGLIVSKKRVEFKTEQDENNFYKRLIFRGLKIFSLGMIITIFSMILIPEKVVIFGVLHCIGLSVVLCVPFLKYRNYNFLFTIIILFSWLIIGQMYVNNPTFFHLIVGFHQANVWKYTVDYFPLVPWFGVCLLGIMIGDWLYSTDKRMFRFPDISKYRPVKFFSLLGKHSLAIYLVHQPVIAGVLYFFVRIY